MQRDLPSSFPEPPSIMEEAIVLYPAVWFCCLQSVLDPGCRVWRWGVLNSTFSARPPSFPWPSSLWPCSRPPASRPVSPALRCPAGSKLQRTYHTATLCAIPLFIEKQDCFSPHKLYLVLCSFLQPLHAPPQNTAEPYCVDRRHFLLANDWNVFSYFYISLFDTLFSCSLAGGNLVISSFLPLEQKIGYHPQDFNLRRSTLWWPSNTERILLMLRGADRSQCIRKGQSVGNDIFVWCF